MKFTFIATFCLLLFSCVDNKLDSNKKLKINSEEYILKSEFQSILDSAHVKGAILLFNQSENKYYSNNFEWAKKGQLPASTFKIPNSIIALETGLLENERSILKWNGKERRLKIWEKDLSLKDAFHFSCVPCYQEIAQKVGTQRMIKYLNDFKYGSINIDPASLKNFWLVGSSRISPFEQINFLSDFYNSKLPIGKSTEKIMKKLMVIEKNENYLLAGKTGWSIKGDHNNGWFVGYLYNDKDWFFATNIEPHANFEMGKFSAIRKTVTMKALEHLNLLK